MNLHLRNWQFRDTGTEIAGFGEARLVRYLSGKFQLLGGSDADRADAREWCSRFMRDAVVACSPSPQPRS